MAGRGLAALVAVCVLSVAGVAGAKEARPFTPGSVGDLSYADQRSLLAGQMVSRPVRFTRPHGGRYVGGVSYQIVRATPARVIAALSDVRSLPHALPRTLSAALLSRGERSARVELTQGKSPFLVTYTVNLEQAEEGDLIRFWLDHSRPHDVRDVWGYFRVTAFSHGKSLVTVAVALDIGPGIARLLFEDRVERIILRAPDKIRSFVEPRAVAGR